MVQSTIGVLLMAYGTPAHLDEVEAYYTHIRRGRKPSPEQLQDLIDRYKAIGGLSPLQEITRRQAQLLEQHLNSRSGADGKRYVVYLGMKHSPPFIADTVKKMKDDGVTKAVGLVLAPHFSKMSVGSYIQTAQEAIEADESRQMQLTFVEHWHNHPLFIEAVSKRVEQALHRLNGTPDSSMVLFSAHSLPERILQWQDPYPDQLRETAQLVANQLNLSNWQLAWQSAGQTAEPWLGPDILDVIRSLHQKGITQLVSCPVGFVSDHLEVLYDIDIECRALCDELGITLVRTESFNDSPDFIDVLTDVVLRQEAGDM